MKMHSPGHSSADSMVASSWPGGHHGEALGPTGVGEDLVAFLDVGEAVVEEGEHVRGDLFAQAVARAEILVDPDLHTVTRSWLGWRWAVAPAVPDTRLAGGHDVVAQD